MNKKTKHHIVPRSRELGKGILGVCSVEAKIHDLSHQLFGNMTPPEIGDWLNSVLWNNKYEITIIRKKKK